MHTKKHHAKLALAAETHQHYPIERHKAQDNDREALHNGWTPRYPIPRRIAIIKKWGAAQLQAPKIGYTVPLGFQSAKQW
jgi:hypothetical protein